jgi:hypothetical protein
MQKIQTTEQHTQLTQGGVHGAQVLGTEVTRLFQGFRTHLESTPPILMRPADGEVSALPSVSTAAGLDAHEASCIAAIVALRTEIDKLQQRMLKKLNPLLTNLNNTRWQLREYTAMENDRKGNRAFDYLATVSKKRSRDEEIEAKAHERSREMMRRKALKYNRDLSAAPSIAAPYVFTPLPFLSADVPM